MSSRRVETALGAGIVAVFFLVRLVLLVVREPFFDELFTLWLARQPFAAILPALRLDSGPPLYYFIARIPSIVALRLLSLAFASAAIGLLVTRRSLGRTRFVAAALLAVYPPAALSAVDARAYALCGLFVAISVLSLRDERPRLASSTLVLAAYTHYYGILFLPLLLRRRTFVHAAVAGVLVLPAIYLASMQPAEAMRWLSDSDPLGALQALAFVGRYEPALFTPAPMMLMVISALGVIAILIGGVALRDSSAPLSAGAAAHSRKEGSVVVLGVIVPLLLAIFFAVAWRPIYFPMRFESVLAVPLVLWMATSLERCRREARVALLATLIGAGAMTLARGALDHARREIDPYRAAARQVERFMRPGERIVATGYLVLETTIAQPRRHVEAWPAEQALHPGWRATTPADAAALPPSSFVWIGERSAPEGAALRRTRSMTPLWTNEGAVIARVAPLYH